MSGDSTASKQFLSKINYSTQSVIDELVNKGYVLVSDSFSPDAIISNVWRFNCVEVVLVSSPSVTNSFTGAWITDQFSCWVYLEHGIKDAEEQTATTNRVIHYVYADGSTARPSVIQTITYKGTNTQPLLTSSSITL